MLSTQDRAVRTLLRELKRGGYHFVTPTPATHARVLGRANGREAVDLRDVFGWNMPFRPELLDRELLGVLQTAGLVEAAGQQRLRATVRVSSLRDNLFVHSAYPTEAEDAVFFGPDSYRFADFVAAEMARMDLNRVRQIVDIGTGAGVGAVVAAGLCPEAFVVATDINEAALHFATSNAACAGISLECWLSDNLDALRGADVIMANPPYIIDDQERSYRDGGSLHGAQVSLEMTAQALPRLAPGGRFLLYSGSAIVGGEDRLRARLHELAGSLNCAIRYRELDPDVFGEELSSPAYHDVDRIAVIGAVMSPIVSTKG